MHYTDPQRDEDPFTWIFMRKAFIQIIANKVLAQLFLVVSHRDSQLFKINPVKNFIRN